MWGKSALLALALSIAACGGGDDDGGTPPDAGSPNHLGELCSADTPCPSDPPHQCIFLNAGNPDVGYCSPVCATDQDCLDGYTGPASGQLSCFVPNQPDACTIVCQSGADCPGDLACVATGGPVMVCTTE